MFEIPMNQVAIESQWLPFAVLFAPEPDHEIKATEGAFIR